MYDSTTTTNEQSPIASYCDINNRILDLIHATWRSITDSHIMRICRPLACPLRQQLRENNRQHASSIQTACESSRQNLPVRHLAREGVESAKQSSKQDSRDYDYSERNAPRTDISLIDVHLDNRWCLGEETSCQPSGPDDPAMLSRMFR